MVTTHKIISFDNQDKLKEGLLKIDDGSYVDVSDYYNQIGKHLEVDTEKVFRDLDQTESERAGRDCFIATAVYGDANAPQVEALRGFRDNVLMWNALGKTVVDFYYGGAGKRTADFLRKHLSSTIPIIRRGLDILVERCSIQKK